MMCTYIPWASTSPEVRMALDITETAARLSILAVNVLAVNRPVTLYALPKASSAPYVVSKSVFCTLCSVKKRLLHPL